MGCMGATTGRRVRRWVPEISCPLFLVMAQSLHAFGVGALHAWHFAPMRRRSQIIDVKFASSTSEQRDWQATVLHVVASGHGRDTFGGLLKFVSAFYSDGDAASETDAIYSWDLL